MANGKKIQVYNGNQNIAGMDKVSYNSEIEG